MMRHLKALSGVIFSLIILIFPSLSFSAAPISKSQKFPLHKCGGTLRASISPFVFFSVSGSKKCSNIEIEIAGVSHEFRLDGADETIRSGSFTFPFPGTQSKVIVRSDTGYFLDSVTVPIEENIFKANLPQCDGQLVASRFLEISTEDVRNCNQLVLTANRDRTLYHHLSGPSKTFFFPFLESPLAITLKSTQGPQSDFIPIQFECFDSVRKYARDESDSWLTYEIHPLFKGYLNEHYLYTAVVRPMVGSSKTQTIELEIEPKTCKLIHLKHPKSFEK